MKTKEKRRRRRKRNNAAATVQQQNNIRRKTHTRREATQIFAFQTYFQHYICFHNSLLIDQSEKKNEYRTKTMKNKNDPKKICFTHNFMDSLLFSVPFALSNTLQIFALIGIDYFFPFFPDTCKMFNIT